MNGRGRFYVLGQQDDKPLSFEAAQDEFKSLWSDARAAHIDLMAHVGGHWVRQLHDRRGKFTRATVKCVRDDAQKIADAALRLVAALDATLRVIDRAHKGERP